MNKNKIIIGVLIISFLVTTFTLAGRISVESKNRSVDVVLDYNEFKELAEESDNPLTWWFQQFKGMGIQYVGLREETIGTLIEAGKPLKIEMAGNIITEVNWRENYPSKLVEYLDETEDISEFDAVIITDSEEVYNFISERLLSRYDEGLFKLIENENLFSIVLKGTEEEALYAQERNVDRVGRAFLTKQRLVSSKLTRLGLGLDPEKVKLIQDSGLQVMARPYQYEGWESEKLVFATFNEYKEYNIKPSVFVFDGDHVFGFPDHVHITKRYMEENGVKIGLIERSIQREYIKQSGINELIKALDYQATGVFSMPEFIQLRFAHYHYTGAEEIENTLYRAVTERNMRLIYFRPFKINKFKYVTDINEYEKMFQRFDTRLAKHGMVLGESSHIPPKKVGVLPQILMGWGVVAAGILLIDALFKMGLKFKLLLLALGGAFVGAVIIVKPTLAGNVLAIMAAIIFASLSMVYFISRCFSYYQQDFNEKIFKKIGRSVKDLLTASLISLVGAIYVASILADIEYFIAMNVYRGVKVSQLIPIVVFVIAYLCYFGYKRKTEDKGIGLRPNDLINLLMEDIKVLYVFIGGVILVVGYIYIARTGHATDLQASSLEMLVRNKLGELLLARPRTKEFLIAFPVLMLGFYAAQKYKYKVLIFATGLVAVMGQTSIINTFSHFRTPVYLSVVRTVYSLGLGIIMGIIYVVLFEVVIKLLSHMIKKLNIQF